jgi:hypothetical protein
VGADRSRRSSSLGRIHQELVVRYEEKLVNSDGCDISSTDVNKEASTRNIHAQYLSTNLETEVILSVIAKVNTAF